LSNAAVQWHKPPTPVIYGTQTKNLMHRPHVAFHPHLHNIRDLG
jgi:hypothetical protein